MKLPSLLLIFLIFFIGCSEKKEEDKSAEDIPEKEKAPEPVKEVDYKSRKYFNAKFEPEKKILTGAGQFHMNEFNNLAYHVLDSTSRPTLCMFYANLKSKDFKKFFRKIENRIDMYEWYVIPQIGLSMTRDGEPEKHYEHLVAKGRYDKQIDTLCLALKNFDRPVFLRIGYEFNGEWNGYLPESYKDAYVRIVNKLRKYEVKNVATVWNVEPNAKDKQFMEYYPGNDYVDWWGIDFFGKNYFSDSTTQAFLDSALYFKKPVMIGEATPRHVGTLDGKEDWNTWFKPFFKTIEQNPQIKALCYINADWSTTFLPDWGNARIEKNDYISDKFKKHLNSELYLGGRKKEQLFKLLKIRQ